MALLKPGVQLAAGAGLSLMSVFLPSLPPLIATVGFWAGALLFAGSLLFAIKDYFASTTWRPKVLSTIVVFGSLVGLLVGLGMMYIERKGHDAAAVLSPSAVTVEIGDSAEFRSNVKPDPEKGQVISFAAALTAKKHTKAKCYIDDIRPHSLTGTEERGMVAEPILLGRPETEIELFANNRTKCYVFHWLIDKNALQINTKASHPSLQGFFRDVPAGTYTVDLAVTFGGTKLKRTLLLVWTKSGSAPTIVEKA